MEKRAERREERNERRQLQREMRNREMENMAFQVLNPPPYPPLSSSDYPYKNTSTPEPTRALFLSAVPSATPRAVEMSLTTPMSRTSSPIDAAEEDADILVAFFIWKLQNTRNPDRRVKWERARDIIMQNDWCVTDLQQMEDGCSAMYVRAMKAGLSDGFARGFKDEIRSFKQYYQQQQGL
jgi:hypothetical protein